MFELSKNPSCGWPPLCFAVLFCAWCIQGTESVKEFLVTKLKDTETALKRSLDEKGLSLRQSASDQEVISFLDSRTQVKYE